MRNRCSYSDVHGRHYFQHATRSLTQCYETLKTLPQEILVGSTDISSDELRLALVSITAVVRESRVVSHCLVS